MAGNSVADFILLILLLVGSAIWCWGYSFSNVGRRTDSIDCDRRPRGVESDPEEGDGGFQLRIQGNPDSYAPEKKYTVVLENSSPFQKFTQFVFFAEPLSLISSDAGTFQLQNAALSMFSKDCPNTILQTSNTPKNNIEVFWTAPRVDSGCVVLKTTVLDVAGAWYMDSGKLSLKLCQGELENTKQPEILETCRACEEAGYELIFEAIWSRQTHPKQFPDDHFSTNFSTIIGASHSADYRMWEYNKLASNGIAKLAINGGIKELERELKSKSKKIRTIIKAKGLVYPHLKERAFALFRTDSSRHLLSIISKFNPSPDWVVGIPALELCLKNGSWVNSRIINLYPIDIGVYEGTTYKAEKVPTIPQGVIRPISSSYPNNSDSPFYNSHGVSIPLAKVVINRQRLFQKPCQFQSDEFDKCALTEWSPFSSCSSSCGKGFQKRTRSFVNGHAAYTHCRAELLDKKPCYTPCTKNGPTEYPQGRCETTEWSDWSVCSCGSLYSVRDRKYINPLSRKSCTEQLQENKNCPSTPLCNCDVTDWSEWSSCNATCGTGMRIRTRLYLKGAAPATCNVERVQIEKCTADIPECDDQVPSTVCLEPKERGPCRGYFQRWYFDSSKKMCMQFVYGGCRGNKNSFDRYSECRKVCESTLGILQNGPIPSRKNKVDCKVTPWESWSPCSRTCGKARKQRRRMIMVNPENGGEPCPSVLIQRRKCKKLPPCYTSSRRDINCSYLPWEEWSPCSQTCGKGIQYRRREVAHPEKASSKECRFQREQMACYRPKCSYD